MKNLLFETWEVNRKSIESGSKLRKKIILLIKKVNIELEKLGEKRKFNGTESYIDISIGEYVDNNIGDGIIRTRLVLEKPEDFSTGGPFLIRMKLDKRDRCFDSRFVINTYNPKKIASIIALILKERENCIKNLLEKKLILEEKVWAKNIASEFKKMFHVEQ